MPITINNYMQDGACAQARAVLAFLSDFKVGVSYDNDTKQYAEILVSPWENRRSHGYVLSMVAKNGKQLNIAFFEPEGFNEIHAIAWKQFSVNSITINSARIDGQSYSDKVTFIADHGDVLGMSRYIRAQFVIFWTDNQ